MSENKTKKREDYLTWDEYFMSIAKLTAGRSKDPNTQVGACIVSKDNRVLSIIDNGCGMTEEELENNLGTIAESGSLKFKEENDGKEDVEIIVYEPTYKGVEFNGCEVINDFEEFSKKSDVILANRYEDILFDVKNKVYTRDLFMKD